MNTGGRVAGTLAAKMNLGAASLALFARVRVFSCIYDSARMAIISKGEKVRGRCVQPLRKFLQAFPWRLRRPPEARKSHLGYHLLTKVRFNSERR